MNYIYDILLNFNEELYDFYDWNMKDDIKHIRRIPLIKVSSEDLILFKENKMLIDKPLLNKIYNKTELFENRKITRLDYACLFCDGIETLGVMFNKKGESIKKTKLLIDEDSEVVDICVHLDEEEFDYHLIKTEKPEYLKTRKEIEIHNYITAELKKLLETKDYEKLKYLYYECFDEEKDAVNEMIDVFMEELEKHFDVLSPKLYDFFKLTSLNK